MSSDSDKTASSASWRSLLQSVASFRGDLSSLTAPPFILSPVSQLEYGAYWYTGADFTAPAKEADPEKRFLLVLKYLFNVMRGQYTRRNETEGYEKKPLNPFLGELFVASLDDGKATVVAEQVSHHPPVSAFHIKSADGLATANGFVGIKARFNGSISIKQSGKTLYQLKLPDGSVESYVIDLPAAHIEGFLTGAPFLELDGKSTVVSSSGYQGVMHFTGAGWVSGSKHSVKAVVSTVSDPEKRLYTIKGQWHKQLQIRGDAKGSKETAFEDLTHTTPVTVTVRDLENQSPLESRKAWKPVADAIRAGNADVIAKEKTVLENKQRELREEEKQQGREWKQRWFELVTPAEAPNSPYVELTSKGPLAPPEPFWRFCPDKFSADADFK